MNDCTAVIGSMTTALKAQKTLLKASIPSTVVKLDSSVTRRGCAYGLEFDCVQSANVQHTLSTAGIRASRYLSGGGYM